MPQSEYVRKDQPIHPRRWQFITAWIIVFSAAMIAMVVWIRHEGVVREHKLIQADYRNCVQNHILLTRVILRTIGLSYEQFVKNPELAIVNTRKLLQSNPLYKSHPDLIDRSIIQTKEILDVSVPSTKNCVQPD